MTDEPPEISILDARLAEIDRRLSSIQTGLLEAEGERPPEPPPPPPEPVPPPPEPVPPPPPPAAELPPRVPVETVAPPPVAPSSAAPAGPAALLAEMRRLADLQEEVLRRTRDLLAAYEQTLEQPTPAGQAAPPAPVQEFSVSAGPFGSTEALRAFERMLERIPEVREVEVRGYEGEDRAIVDVHLFEPKP
jgi:hypothetical protein